MTESTDAQDFPPIRTLGISVMPGYLQSEGVGSVLERLVHTARVTDVTFYPKLLEPCPDGEGVRHPPHDGDAGHVRLFDRPVWGRREFWARSMSSYEPDMALFKGLRYQPTAAGALTSRDGRLVAEFLAGAKAARLRLVLQTPATIPARLASPGGPCPAEEDLARLPDGRVPEMQVDRFGSLASEEILAFGAAQLVDLVRAYPQVDAIRLDWPEMPPYTVDTIFCDFSPHARRAADELGFDFETMRRDAEAAYTALLGGETRLLGALLAAAVGDQQNVAVQRWPALVEFLAFKRALVMRLLKRYRAALDAAGAGNVGLVLQGFPPPWNRLSGFDYGALAPACAGLGLKLYTMHWPMMVRYYSRALLAASPSLDERTVVADLVRAFGLVEPAETFDPGDYSYPDPDTEHPVSSAAITHKVREVVAAVAKRSPLYALAHSYGPLPDFKRRLRAALDGGVDRVWLQRYAYLSDTKLAWLGSLPRI